MPACGTGGLGGEGEGYDYDDGGGGYIPDNFINGDWDIEIVDDNGDAGHLNILNIDAAGRPCISYFAVSGLVYWIRYALFNGFYWEIETVHQTDTKTGSGMAVAPSGNPVLSFVGGEPDENLFYWPFQSDLTVAAWNGIAWDRETIEGGPFVVVGLWSSLAYDGFGQAGISYQDLGNGIDYTDFHMRDLKYAYSTGGGTWENVTVEEDGGGYYSQLIFDEDDHPAIAYCGVLDGESQPVKLAYRGDFGWEIYTVDSLGDCAEGSLSLRNLPSGGGFGIAYYDNRFQDLKYASFFSGLWTRETVEAHNKVGKYCSLDYDQNGRPVISYYYCGRGTDDDCQGGGDLRVARRTQTGWTIEIVETEGNTGLFTSLEITDSGEHFIAYYDQTLNALKLASQR